nr:hypothetical protein [Tanacetum cinerariifolium]
MLAVRDIAEEAEAQVPAQGDDVHEHAAEEVANDVVPPTPTSPSPSSPVIQSSPPHQSPCPPQPQDAEGLENANATQQLKIVKLKARVEKLERLNKVKSSKLRRLKKVGTSQRVESSDDVKNVFSMQEDDTEVQEVVEVITTAKLITEVVTAVATQVAAANTPIPAAKPKTLTITAAPATIEEMEKEDEEIIKSINETPAQKALKGRKLSEEAQEANDLKKILEIVQDEDDDVFVKATPLAQKVLVVDYQVVVIDNKPKYKIIRADDTHQFYISFTTLLKNFDRED